MIFVADEQEMSVALRLGAMAGNSPDASRLEQTAKRSGAAKAENARQGGIEADWEKLKSLEQVYGPEHPEVAEVLHRIAVFSHRWKKYDEAEPLYKRALAIVESLSEAGCREATGIVEDLACLYQDEKESAEFDPRTRRRQTLRGWIFGARDRAEARRMSNLANFYEDNGRENAGRPKHPEVAGMLHRLAAFYHRQEEYEEAEPLYKRALAMVEESLKVDSQEVARFTNNLGRLYHDQGKYAEAEPLYQRSLAILETLCNSDDPKIARRLGNLAALYFIQRRDREAVEMLHRLAIFYHRQKNYDKAESLYLRALKIVETKGDSQEAARFTEDLARLYCERSLEIMQTTVNPGGRKT